MQQDSDSRQARPLTLDPSPEGRGRGQEQRLRITEIFHSLQGEARSSGWPTVFVRLTGCPLRCTYCDTAYAFHGGEWRSFDEILAAVRSYETRRVCVTGGEPLAQKRSVALMRLLCDEGFEVSIETGGAHDIEPVDPRVVRVVDVKTPASGECARNRWENLPLLRAHDQVKFVICDRADYEWSRDIAVTHALPGRCEVLFSPSYGQLAPAELAQWILDDRLDVRFQTQLHKQLWGGAQGR